MGCNLIAVRYTLNYEKGYFMNIIIKILFLSLLISLPSYSQNNSLNFIQTKEDSSWGKNIIISPDSIYLSKNNIPDSSYILMI